MINIFFKKKQSCAWPGKFEYKTPIKLCNADGSELLDNNLVND